MVAKEKLICSHSRYLYWANLCFLLFLTDTDVCRNLSKWYFEDTGLKNKVETIVKGKSISKNDLALLYDNQFASLSKSALVVVIPFMALMLMLVNFRKKYLFGKHLVFATDFLFFLLIFMALLSFIFSAIPVSGKYFNKIPILLAMIVYLGFPQKNFYKDGIGWSILKSFLGTIMILLLILLYREIVSYISFLLVS